MGRVGSPHRCRRPIRAIGKIYRYVSLSPRRHAVSDGLLSGVDPRHSDRPTERLAVSPTTIQEPRGGGRGQIRAPRDRGRAGQDNAALVRGSPVLGNRDDTSPAPWANWAVSRIGPSTHHQTPSPKPDWQASLEPAGAVPTGQCGTPPGERPITDVPTVAATRRVPRRPTGLRSPATSLSRRSNSALVKRLTGSGSSALAAHSGRSGDPQPTSPLTGHSGSFMPVSMSETTELSERSLAVVCRLPPHVLGVRSRTIDRL
jgi:hypothetical protein